MANYSIRESGSISVRNVILYTESIRELASLAFDVIAQIHLQPGEAEQKPVVRMVALGPTVYKGSTLSMLEPGGPLDSKRIESLSITYGYWGDSQFTRFSLKLQHTARSSDESSLDVSSIDPTWVAAALRRFEDRIKLLPPRRRVSKLQEYGAAAVIWVSFGLLGAGLGFLVATIGRTQRHGQFDWNPVAVAFGAVLFGVCLFGGELAGFWAAEKLPSLYPSVEIQTGPEHLNVEKRRRDRLRRYAMLLAVPMVIGILTGIIDGVILKF